ncbi:MAG: hypothetical protein HKN04_13000 [Rhodothermaceae bacterium]|nr:hypothetical protein [Rhodothermaceae bacterium]
METTTVAFAPKTLSGIDVVDDIWGGLYRGGSYLTYGRAASGRGLLTLMFTQTGTLLEEPCLFIAPDRPKDLMIQAASIGFDLHQAYESGLVRLMRIPPLFNLQNIGDEGVAKALRDLVSIIRQHRPSRVVINDFTPFVLFRSFDRLRSEFVHMLEQIDSLDTTLLLGIAEPGSQRSEEVIEFMKNQMTGALHLELTSEDPSSTSRRLTMVPHIGHIRHETVENWDLESLIESGAKLAASIQMLPARQTPRPVSEPVAQQAAPELGYEVADMMTEPRYDEPVLTDAPPAAPEIDLADNAAPVIEQPLVQPPAPLAYEEPTYEAPAYEAPAYEEPSYEAPTYEAPAYEASAFDEPTYEAPAYEAPVMDEVPMPEPEPEPEISYTDRAGFSTLLQQHFVQREVADTPFLLLAMRMDRGDGRGSRPFDFEFILDLVHEALREQDAMLADMEQERLVVLLGNSRPEEAQAFFSRLKNRLRQDAPQQADHLLHSVSAIVVPDGKPFQNAEEFLTYALDEG